MLQAGSTSRTASRLDVALATAGVVRVFAVRLFLLLILIADLGLDGPVPRWVM